MPNKLIVKKKFPKAAAWVLINNTSHTSRRFTSLKLLREYADLNHMQIKKSKTTEKTYYTDAFAFVPAG